jgi:hypothetical protein
MRRFASLLALLAIALVPVALRAQAMVRGTVFDSLLTRRPLEGATVVVQGTNLTATTDRRGQFEIRGIAPGRHAFGFSHPMLDSLDIAAPGRIVDVAPNEQVVIALATPSPNGASLLLCRVAAEASTAVLFGTVRGAEDGTPLRGADVQVRWFEVVIARGGARQTEHVARDSTDAEGRYILCGVPNDISLTLVATHQGQATGPLHLELDSLGVGRRELRVSATDPASTLRPEVAPDDTVPTARADGRGRLAVTVRTPAGAPVHRAIVGVRGWAASATTDEAGRAVLVGVPSGTQTIVVRAIGMEPQHLLANFAANVETRVDLKLDRFVTLLPSVAVVGQRADPLSARIEQRLRAGQGKLIEGDELKDLAGSASGWARMPGVTIGSDADPIPHMRGAAGVPCSAVIWLDGMRIQNITGWELRGMLLNAKRVEVYNSASRVPAEFTTMSMNGCGAVLIWSY